MRKNLYSYRDEILDQCPATLNKSFIEKILNGHRVGRANGDRIFSLLMLTKSFSNLELT